MLDGGNSRPQEKSKQMTGEITQMSRRKYTACLEGPPREVKVERETGSGAHAFMRVRGWVENGLVGSNQKELGCGKFHEGLI